MKRRNEMRIIILDALERLLETRTYSQVSISDICAEAHISKPTFYRYFQHKNDVIHWIARYALQVGMGKIGRSFSWEEGYYRTACVHYKHKIIFCDEQYPILISDLLSMGATYMNDYLIDTITNYLGLELTPLLRFQVECVVVYQGIMSRRWSERNMDISPRVMAAYSASCVPRDLFLLLNDPQHQDHECPPDDLVAYVDENFPTIPNPDFEHILKMLVCSVVTSH